MQEYATLQVRRLKWLHNHFPKYKEYPRDNRFNSGIYDLEYKEIFSTMESKEVHLDKSLYFTKNYVVYVSILSDYYLGAKYLLIEIPKNEKTINNIYRNIIIYSLFALVILFAFGYYLSKLFVKPMKRSIEILDNFIKDTTHEINTPITIINSNIEMLNTNNFSPKDCRKLNRIKIASRTLASIYKDLKFTTLEHLDSVEETEFNLSELVQERVDYFMLFMDSKNIKVKLNLDKFVIKANRGMISRMVDNVLSNAIKYNKVGGSISVTIKDNMLIIEDSGIGIDNENIKNIFSRYSRFNKHEGGFGLGLNIVKQIANYYKITIDVESKKDKGTRFIFKW